MNLYSADDVAELFQADRRKVIEWTRRYGWAHVRVGRSVYFTDEHLEQIVASHTVHAKDSPSPGIPGQTRLSRARSRR